MHSSTHSIPDPYMCLTRVATSAAVTGSFETLLGSDPHIVDMLCSKMSVSHFADKLFTDSAAILT